MMYQGPIIWIFSTPSILVIDIWCTSNKRFLSTVHARRSVRRQNRVTRDLLRVPVLPRICFFLFFLTPFDFDFQAEIQNRNTAEIWDPRITIINNYLWYRSYSYYNMYCKVKSRLVVSHDHTRAPAIYSSGGNSFVLDSGLSLTRFVHVLPKFYILVGVALLIIIVLLIMCIETY